MKCSKCNQEISEDSAFCPKCGVKVVVQAENEKEQKTNTENKKEKEIKKAILEKWNKLNSFNKLEIVLFVIFAFALIGALLFSKTLSGIISIIQIVGITVAYLIEKGKIHVKKDWYKYAIVIICILLSYCYIQAFSNKANVEKPKANTTYSDTNEEIDWSELVIGDKIPEIRGHKGKILLNTDTKINMSISNITNKEYYSYLEECKKRGYTIDEKKSDYTFEAISEENLKINLFFNSGTNELTIRLSPFEKEQEPENVIDNSIVENTLTNETAKEEINEQNTVQEEVKKEEPQPEVKKEEPKPEVREAESDGKIGIPKAASSFKYEKYQDVLTGFTSLGFTNVKTNVIYDVGNGFFSSGSAGDVKEVSINGNNNFKQGDRFDKNAEVIITYRDFETNVPATSFTKYTVNKLEQDLDANALNAKDTHNNELVEITGKLSNIDSSGKYITLERTDEPFTIRSISCYIKNDEQKEKVKKMTIGKSVTVRGKITAVGEVLGYSMDIYSIP